MKSLHNIAVNYGMTLNSGDGDTNQNGVYAELSIIASEPKYVLGVDRIAQRTTEISEFEIGITKEGAKRMIAIMKDIHARLVKLEKEKL